MTTAPASRSKGMWFDSTYAVSKLGQFHSPLFAVSFGRDRKSCWSLLCGIYVKGSKRSKAGKWKKSVIDSFTLESSKISKQILLNGWWLPNIKKKTRLIEREDRIKDAGETSWRAGVSHYIKTILNVQTYPWLPGRSHISHS